MCGLAGAPLQKLFGALTLIVQLTLLGMAQSGLAQRQHVVAPGDTLFALASRYTTSVDELSRLNGLSSHLLKIGQVLELPTVAGFRRDTSAPGETLADVAARTALQPETLRLANPELPLRQVLATGTVVRVPPADGLSVLIEGGESLLELAIRHGASPGELIRVNGLSNLADAKSGDWLLIPLAEPVAGAGPITLARADGEAGMTGADSALPVTMAPAIVADRSWHEAQQAELLRLSPPLLAAFEPLNTDFVFPLRGALSSRFGWRNISVAGNRFHGGIDLAVDSGTVVAAAGDGVVARADWVGAYGYAVYLDHADGIQTRYAHLSRLLVNEGEVVRQGDTIALTGSTGASTGPHLHFELRLAGQAVDPLPLLR